MDLDQCACSGKTLSRLLHPAILALLARGRTHGYDMVQRLQGMEMFVETPPDTSGVYKVLKSMEEEGLVSANWEFDAAGPARRSYALTKDGKACLKRWAETLKGYRAQIDGLLSIVDLAVPAGLRAPKGRCRKG